MGGKNKSQTIGYWYNVLYHAGLGAGPFDAFLEFRGGDKTAWQGELTSSGTISIDAPNLWGGEKDQGGIVSDVDVMFGEPTQVPNAYLLANLGSQVPAWRGLATLVFKGGKYGAMNPYPQKASYKIRKIKKGWDSDPCWYPETAQIIGAVTGPAAVLNEQFAEGNLSAYAVLEGIDSGFSIVTDEGSTAIRVGPSEGSSHNVIARPLPSISPLVRFRARFKLATLDADDCGGVTLRDAAGQVIFTFGVARAAGVDPLRRPAVAFHDQPESPGNPMGDGMVTVGRSYQFDATYDRDSDRFVCTIVDMEDASTFATIDVPVTTRSDVAFLGFVVDDFDGAGVSIFDNVQVIVGVESGYMNPAHVLYYARTHSDIGRESTANLNDASYRAAADQLYAEGFGICTEYDPQAESLEEFEQRICRLIGGSVSRSLVDGQWYLDLARGNYVLADLPVLTDDDILDFSEQPTTLDGATNSLSVKYFDPERKESIVTPPVQALALIDSFGTIHQTSEYPEIPNAELAVRVADRDLRATVTPTRVLELTTTRKPYPWRPNQYFRLQAPRRGIADMVCILGERQIGTLRSGAIKLRATQDIYSLPATTHVGVEPGVDTRPPQTPVPVTLQHAFEAPYIDVSAALPRAELQALPPDVGFAVAVAADPAVSRDFTMMVAQNGGEYAAVDDGEWCPTALVVEASSAIDTAFTLSDARGLAEVAVGTPGLWGSEWVRVDAIDAVSNTVQFARGCADTVPQRHLAGERVWFYASGAAIDPTEYTDGETIDVKLLTNTGSQQMSLSGATPLAVTFDQRAARPYPPGALRITDDLASSQAYPVSAVGALTVSWAHRDRLQQADQLVDESVASIGPESGTTYTIRYYINDVLDNTVSGVSGTSTAPYTFSADGIARVEVDAVRDGLTSWQAATAEFAYLVKSLGVRITVGGDRRVGVGGLVRVTKG